MKLIKISLITYGNGVFRGFTFGNDIILVCAITLILKHTIYCVIFVILKGIDTIYCGVLVSVIQLCNVMQSFQHYCVLC